jgi:hypothetical protein
VLEAYLGLCLAAGLEVKLGTGLAGQYLGVVVDQGRPHPE